MLKIICDKKSGFKHASDKLFYIYDYRGVLFYTNEFLKKKRCCFNLPEGQYFSETLFEKLHRPNKHININLPPKQRDIKVDKFEIRFENNPNKATVYYDKGLIVFDNYYKTCPLPELFFTLYHEHGHLNYWTEKYCDLFAAKKMLSEGYNISQIGKASIMMLSDRAKDRKYYLVDKLLPNK
jgi:hypothetical protein